MTPQPPTAPGTPRNPPGSNNSTRRTPAAGSTPRGSSQNSARSTPSSVSEAVTRTQADTTPPNLQMMLTEVYGAGRGGRPNTKAAAADLGVSQRTVQRWVTNASQRNKVSAAKLAQVEQKFQTKQNSPTHRRTQLSPAREKRLRTTGAKVRFNGTVSVSSDRRKRKIEYRFTGDQLDPVIDAYLQGGEKGARQAFEDMLNDYYAEGMGIDSIDSLEFLR